MCKTHLPTATPSHQPRMPDIHPLNGDLNICTYNTRSLNDTRLDAFIEELCPSNPESKSIKWDVIGLCKTKLKETFTQKTIKGHLLLNNGVEAEETASKGVGFLVQQSHIKSTIEFKPISPRLAMIRLKAKNNNLTIIQVYAPTSAHGNADQKNKNEEETDSFYDELQILVNSTVKRDTLIIW